MSVLRSCALGRSSFLLLLVTVASLLAAPRAEAQVELVVRLQDRAEGALAERLRAPSLGAQTQQQGAAAQDTALVRLFAQVEQARPVFARPAAGGAQTRSTGRAAARQPIPAYTLQLPDSAALRQARQQLAQRPDVAYTQENHLYQIERSSPLARRRAPAEKPRSYAPPLPYAQQGDPLLDSLRFFPVIRAPEAHEVTRGDASVTVGVVDTGIFYEHPDLEGQIWENEREIPDNGRDDDGNGFVDDVRGFDFVDRPDVLNTGDYAERDPDASHDRLEPASQLGNPHGTNVAGIIAAAGDNGTGIRGVAPGVKLVPLRAFGGDGAGADDDVAAAIVYGADLGVDVLNFSFGDVYYSRLMEEAIQYAAAQGVAMTASAGNNAAGELQEEHYPSDYPEVISVAQLAVRVTLEDGLVLTIPGKYGTGLDLSAPGTDIYTTTLPLALTDGDDQTEPDSTDYYERLGGSSFAAPQVAATAALLRSLDPDLSPASLRSIVTASAEDLEEEGWDQRTGAGLLDAASAVRRALPARTEIIAPESDGGVSAQEVAVVGSALDPSFRSFTVSYARGDTVGFDEDDLDFTQVGERVREQVLRDTLAVWNTGNLPEDLYTLRLAVHLQDGTTVEERRRIHVDRSAPEIDPRFVDKGMIEDAVGVLADVRTDDLSNVTMEVERGGRVYPVESDRRARRHGLTWTAPGSGGETVQVRLRATNVAGLSSSIERTVALPPNRINTALFEEQELDVPSGLLVPKATDFDADSLREIVFTAYGPRASRTDSLFSYEWDGSEGGFSLSSTLLTNLLPRDAGDPDGDEAQELLFQIGGASLLIEQPESPSDAFPDFSNISFIDTTGLGTDTTDALNGALLTNLDGDEYGEVLGYDGDVWRVVEAQPGGGYERVAALGNPTRDTDDSEYGPAFENGFGVGRAQTGDFDGDEDRAFVAIDNGGDFIVYEAKGDDRYEATWSYATRRYAGAGRRVAAGDLDGDGVDEFVTYTRPVVGVNSEVEREPLIGRYYVFDRAGDDDFRLADSLAVQGVDFYNNSLADGSMTTADFDGDGRDELVVVDPPALYVFGLDDEDGLVPRFYRGVTDAPTEGSPRSNGLESPTVVVADFDGSGGGQSIVASAADGQMRRFAYQRGAATAPPPRWVRAASPARSRVQLAWRAPGADSVVVFRGTPNGAFDRYARADSSLLDTTRAPRRYALRAYYGGSETRVSPLSEARIVRPEAPPAVAGVRYPAPGIVRLRFSRRLERAIRTEQFAFAAGDETYAPAGLTIAEDGRVLVLRFERRVAGQAGTLRWDALESVDGVPTAQNTRALAFPEDQTGTLIVKNWDIVDGEQVALTFSAPLDRDFAVNPDNYALNEQEGLENRGGTVSGVAYDPSEPSRVVVSIADVRIGPTGRENALTVTNMRSQDGQTLAPEGNTIRLSEAAEDLDDVYVYPNPYRAGRHSSDGVIIAGLPAEASVQVLSVQGTLVRALDERGSDGGLRWDLRGRSGDAVPSGVYLIRVDAPDADPVLKKAAVIR